MDPTSETQTILKRGDVPAPVLKRETHPMPSLGGSVIVSGLLLADVLTLASPSSATEVQPGESEGDAMKRIGAHAVAATLAKCVLLEDGKPMWTPEQWSIHGATHPGEVIALYQVAQRLNGGNGETAAKN
jgi:hypothetical protein